MLLLRIHVPSKEEGDRFHHTGPTDKMVEGVRLYGTFGVITREDKPTSVGYRGGGSYESDDSYVGSADITCDDDQIEATFQWLHSNGFWNVTIEDAGFYVEHDQREADRKAQLQWKKDHATELLDQIVTIAVAEEHQAVYRLPYRCIYEVMLRASVNFSIPDDEDDPNSSTHPLTPAEFFEMLDEVGLCNRWFRLSNALYEADWQQYKVADINHWVV